MINTLLNIRDSEQIRNYLLFSPKKENILTLEEILHVEKNYYGEEDLLSLYGLTPKLYYSKGIRILGRTAIECTVDIQAKEFAKTASHICHLFFPNSFPIVIDLFAGSGNTLFHIASKLKAITSLGFEKNFQLFHKTKSNFNLINFKCEWVHGDSLELISQYTFDTSTPLVFIISPPWGTGFDFKKGLDLQKTSPPIPHILLHLLNIFKYHPTYFFIQVYQKLVAESLAPINCMFNYSFLEVKHVMKEGMNTGLLCIHNQ